MCLHEAEESHQHYLRQKVCGASRTTMKLHLALCCSREPAASLYITLIRSDLYQFNEFNACAQVSVCLCVCRCLCTVHRFTRSSTCSIQRMIERQGLSGASFMDMCAAERNTKYLTNCTVPVFWKDALLP